MSDHIIFWFNNHPLSPLAEEMDRIFIPVSGKTEFVQSEIVRSILRINNDYYNNGFGNNMSHAIAYIERYHIPSDGFGPAFARIKEAAMEPWRTSNLDDDFNFVISEIYLTLQQADKDGSLKPIGEEMFDMPYTDINYPEHEYDEDEEAYMD